MALTDVAPATAITLTLDTLNATNVNDAIQSVEFFQDGTLVGAVTTAPYRWVWPGAATPGDYRLSMKIYTNDDLHILPPPLVITVKPVDKTIYLPVVYK